MGALSRQWFFSYSLTAALRKQRVPRSFSLWEKAEREKDAPMENASFSARSPALAPG